VIGLPEIVIVEKSHHVRTGARNSAIPGLGQTLALVPLLEDRGELEAVRGRASLLAEGGAAIAHQHELHLEMRLPPHRLERLEQERGAIPRGKDDRDRSHR